MIPETVTAIDAYAFEGHTALATISIPADVAVIGEGAFADCTGLTTVTSNITIPYDINDNTFSATTYETATLYVPYGTIELYRNANGWKNFLNMVEMEPSLTILDGLVAYYPFNGNANDESGHGNNGTPMSSVTLTTGLHGDANGAYQFGGTSNPGYIHVPNSESLKIGDGWSFAAYIKPLTLSGMDGYGRIADRGSFCIMAKSHDRRGVVFKYEYPTDDSFNIGFGGMGWGIDVTTENSGTHLGEWTHVAITKLGNHYKMYVNGEMLFEEETANDFSTADEQDLYFGKFSDMWYPMNGVLDEVRIYNRALTAEEVKTLAKYADNVAGSDVIIGDVNGSGDVTPADAIMILYHYFGVVQTGFILAAADVNGDKNISPADAIEALYIYFGAGRNSNACETRPTAEGMREPE